MNRVLALAIPFNRPHGFRVVPLPGGGIRVEVPFHRVNRNHVKGIHACCLATAAEFCSGLTLMAGLEARKYRILMTALAVEYHYQAKAAAFAELPPLTEGNRAMLAPLERGEAVLHTAEVPLKDVLGNHLATARITWQLKPWTAVRTAV
jgi:acyl-coenzyme A thioesterase PaaI-like protein